MINPDEKIDDTGTQQQKHPGRFRLHIILYKDSREVNQSTLTGNGGHTPESIADTNKKRLFVGIQPQHIEAVGCNIVRSRTESNKPEKDQAPLYKIRCRNGKPGQRQQHTHQHLHGHSPKPFGTNIVDKRSPEGLNNPGKVQPAGIQGNIGIRQTKILVNNSRHGNNNGIGQTLCKIEAGNPSPRIDRFFALHVRKRTKNKTLNKDQIIVF